MAISINMTIIDRSYADTAPPKQRLKNLQQSMYEAGLAPGALVYFSYESPRGKY